MPESNERQASEFPGVFWKIWDSPQGAEYFWYLKSLSEANHEKALGRDEFFQRIFLSKSQDWVIVGG